MTDMATNPFDLSMQKAMKLCWTFDPKKRPGAREIADLLYEALQEMKDEF